MNNSLEPENDYKIAYQYSVILSSYEHFRVAIEHKRLLSKWKTYLQ